MEVETIIPSEIQVELPELSKYKELTAYYRKSKKTPKKTKISEPKMKEFNLNEEDFPKLPPPQDQSAEKENKQPEITDEIVDKMLKKLKEKPNRLTVKAKLEKMKPEQRKEMLSEFSKLLSTYNKVLTAMEGVDVGIDAEKTKKDIAKFEELRQYRYKRNPTMYISSSDEEQIEKRSTFKWACQKINTEEEEKKATNDESGLHQSPREVKITSEGANLDPRHQRDSVKPELFQRSIEKILIPDKLDSLTIDALAGDDCVTFLHNVDNKKIEKVSEQIHEQNDNVPKEICGMKLLENEEDQGPQNKSSEDKKVDGSLKCNAKDCENENVKVDSCEILCSKSMEKSLDIIEKPELKSNEEECESVQKCLDDNEMKKLLETRYKIPSGEVFKKKEYGKYKNEDAPLYEVPSKRMRTSTRRAESASRFYNRINKSQESEEKAITLEELEKIVPTIFNCSKYRNALKEENKLLVQDLRKQYKEVNQLKRTIEFLESSRNVIESI